MNAMRVEMTALAESEAKADTHDEPPKREEAGHPADYLTSGLDLFIHVLRHPEELFGTPSQELAVNRYPSDPAHLAQGLRRYFAWSNKRCMDAYARMRIAAGLTRRFAIAICGGPLEVRFFEDPGDASLDLTVVVCVDADEASAEALNKALLHHATQCCVYLGCLDLRFESVHSLRVQVLRRNQLLAEYPALQDEDEDEDDADDADDMVKLARE